MIDHALGFEIDFGWAPNFFENTTGEGDFEFGDNNVTTFMANLTLGAPIGGQSGPGIRPYASGGVGILKIKANHARDLFNVESTDWGFNLGGGNCRVLHRQRRASRGSSNFRSLQDDEPDDELDIALTDFHFWRGTIGLTFRF